jgi:hypothetical protein
MSEADSHIRNRHIKISKSGLRTSRQNIALARPNPSIVKPQRCVLFLYDWCNIYHKYRSDEPDTNGAIILFYHELKYKGLSDGSKEKKQKNSHFVTDWGILG